MRNKEYLFFEVFSHEKPQEQAKNGEKQLKCSNFETYHGFHRNLFKVSVGKTPKTAKTCSKQKTNYLFTFYCDSIKSKKQLHLIFFHRWSCMQVFNQQNIQLLLKFSQNHIYLEPFSRPGFLVSWDRKNWKTPEKLKTNLISCWCL